jgi:hypothetical protein
MHAFGSPETMEGSLRVTEGHGSRARSCEKKFSGCNSAGKIKQAGRMSMEMVNLVRLSVDLHTRETVKLHRVVTVLELKRPGAVLKLGNLRWSTKSVMHAGRPCSDERCAQCV